MMLEAMGLGKKRSDRSAVRTPRIPFLSRVKARSLISLDHGATPLIRLLCRYIPVGGRRPLHVSMAKTSPHWGSRIKATWISTTTEDRPLIPDAVSKPISDAQEVRRTRIK